MPTNSVKNIEWLKLGDDVKRMWKIEWWVMKIKWLKKWNQTALRFPFGLPLFIY